jgi:hypothetical protein
MKPDYVPGCLERVYSTKKALMEGREQFLRHICSLCSIHDSNLGFMYIGMGGLHGRGLWNGRTFVLIPCRAR